MKAAKDKILDLLPFVNEFRFDEDFLIENEERTLKKLGRRIKNRTVFSGINEENWADIIYGVHQALDDSMREPISLKDNELTDLEHISMEIERLVSEGRIDSNWDWMPDASPSYKELLEKVKPANLKRMSQAELEEVFRSEDLYFDLPGRYGAGENGEPTFSSSRRVLFKLRRSLVNLLEVAHRERKKPYMRTSNAWRNGIVEIQVFFEDLQFLKPIFSVKWSGDCMPIPQLSLSVGGIDSRIWWTLFQFLTENPKWFDIIGRCPECGCLFKKTRRNQEYCRNPCKGSNFRRKRSKSN